MTSSTNFPGPVKVQGRDVATFLRNEDGSIRALVDPAGNAFDFQTAPATYSGTIVGNGTAQSIAPGLAPDLVFAKADAATVAVFKNADQWLRQTDTLSSATSRSDSITLTSTGFSVGADALVNANAVNINYFAYSDNGAGAVKSLSWHGNATTGRTVDITAGLDIAAMIVKRDSAALPVLAIGSGSWLEDGTAGSYAAINADGTLTLNNSANTNEWAGVSGEGINAALILNKPEFVSVTRYTGNATARRIPLAWKAAFVMIWPLGNSASKIQMWMSSLAAGYTALSNNAAHQTGRISSVDDGGLSLTSHDSVNKSGIEYACIAFRDTGVSVPRKAPAFIKRRNKSVQLSTGYIDCGTSDTLALTGAYSIEFYGSFTPSDETPFVGGAGVNDETGKQYPLIWRSNGADGGSGTISQSWGLGLFNPMNQGVATWTGCSILSPSTRFFNLVQNSSGNLTYNPFNTGKVINSGRVAHIIMSHDGGGVWRTSVDGRIVKERKLPVLTTVGGPLTPDGAWPLSGASTIIGARKRATTPEFAHSLNFRMARLYSRGLTPAEHLARYKSAVLGQTDSVTDFVEEWDASNASGLLLPATRNSANNGTIISGLVVG